MPVPPDDIIEKLRRETRDSAAAFVEDMAHIREVISKPAPGPSRADMRRLSAILRRLIVERDIQKIATPRMGRIRLNAPDMKALVKMGFQNWVDLGKTNISTFMPGVVPVHGSEVNAHVHTRVAMNVDSFAAQPVLCFRSVWMRRQTIIKFVANTLSGVHSNSSEDTEEEKLLSIVRTSLVRKVSDDGDITVHINRKLFTPMLDMPPYDPDALDPTLLQLMVTANLIVESEGAKKLEDAVRQELSI